MQWNQWILARRSPKTAGSIRYRPEEEEVYMQNVRV